MSYFRVCEFVMRGVKSFRGRSRLQESGWVYPSLFGQLRHFYPGNTPVVVVCDAGDPNQKVVRAPSHVFLCAIDYRSLPVNRLGLTADEKWRPSAAKSVRMKWRTERQREPADCQSMAPDFS